MRVIVSGGRNYNDKSRLFDYLDIVNSEFPTSIKCLVHGGATGADSLSGEWAKSKNIKCVVHRADWYNIIDGKVKVKINRKGLKYNALAGVNRNISMLKTTNPDLVMCFPGGTGTSHMLKNSIKHGVEVWEIHNMGYTIHNKKEEENFIL